MSWHTWKCAGCDYQLIGPKLREFLLCPNCWEELYENYFSKLDPTYDRTKMNAFPGKLYDLIWPSWQIRFVPIGKNKWNSQVFRDGEWHSLTET